MLWSFLKADERKSKCIFGVPDRNRTYSPCNADRMAFLLEFSIWDRSPINSMAWVSQWRSKVVGRFLNWPLISFFNLSLHQLPSNYYFINTGTVQRHSIFQRDCCCVENIFRVHEGNICINPAFFKQGVYSILNFNEFGRIPTFWKD